MSSLSIPNSTATMNTSQVSNYINYAHNTNVTNSTAYNHQFTTTSSTITSVAPLHYLNNNQIIITDMELGAGIECKLPDGSTLKIDDVGNYEIIDENQKITYKANNLREFNRYINASDLLEEFIEYLGENRVKQKDILNVPIEIFITWLVYKASEQDRIDNQNDILALETKTKELKIVHRCKYCGRFLTNKFKEIGVNFCNSNHFDLFVNQQ